MIINQGEVRQVGIEVISKVKQNFIIEASDYKILKIDGTVVETGESTIDGYKILTLFSAQEQGIYNIEFTYRIGPEILKAKLYVEVKQ